MTGVLGFYTSCDKIVADVAPQVDVRMYNNNSFHETMTLRPNSTNGLKGRSPIHDLGQQLKNKLADIFTGPILRSLVPLSLPGNQNQSGFCFNHIAEVNVMRSTCGATCYQPLDGQQFKTIAQHRHPPAHSPFRSRVEPHVPLCL